MGITAGSREVPGRNVCDRRHTYRIIIIIIIIIIIEHVEYKTKVISVKIGATGTISKSFRIYMRNIPGKHEVKKLQKTAILGTAHILRKLLM